MRDSTNNTSVSGERRANTQFFGLDVNLPVFAISSALAIFFSAFVLFFPEKSSFLTDTMDFVVDWFGTLFTLSMSVFTLIIFLLIVSPFGKIRLAAKHSVPEYRFVSGV